MKSIAAALPSNSSMYSAISALNASRVDSKFCSMSSFISSTCQLSSVSVYPVSHCLHHFCSFLFASPLNFTVISQWSHKSMSSMKSWVSTGSDTWERLWDLVRNNALNGFGRQQWCHSVLGTVQLNHDDKIWQIHTVSIIPRQWRCEPFATCT